ncbi:MAG: DEAD/DEAH box helicase family protein, partial [Armatimonadetes bacterium]|nr:DEAD/DEAH box helicase family protein [Armatimonadota bacterium]
MPDFSLINNLDVHLADAFTAALQDARNLDVAVAYFSYSGYQHILDSVEALLKRGGVVRFLLGVHPTPGAKALLLLLRQAQRDFGADHVAVRFIPPSDERDFHAKVYLIDRSPAATLIIGSSNLSQQGFVNNLELNYREIIPVDSEKFQQVSAWFQRLFTEEAKEFSWQTIEELFTIPPLAPTPTIPQPLSSTASYTDHFIALQLHYLRIPLGGRITPFFYQIEDVKNLVDEVENRIAGRRGKLIAHEVGLGKTVVAGLTIKELLQRRKIERILIVTPASVMEQWQEELWEKIGEDFAIITADTLAEQGNSAWHTAQQAICSVDFLKDQMLQTNPERQQRRHTPYILQESWPADLQFDFIVFDESHYAKSNAAMRYKALWQLVRQLRKPDGFILLLSATPVMNKEEELYYQLALTYPDMLRDADGKQQLPTRSDLGHLQDAWQQLRHSAIRRKLRKEEDIRPLFAERAAPTDRAFTLSSAETELYREFAMWITEQSEYYSILSAQADTQNSPYKRIAPFIKIAYLRQFCSSSEAIYRSLVGEDERTDDQWTLESEWNSQRSLFGDIGGSSTLSMRMGLKGRLLLAIRNGAIPFGNAGQRDIEELRELFGALEESSDGSVWIPLNAQQKRALQREVARINSFAERIR